MRAVKDGIFNPNREYLSDEHTRAFVRLFVALTRLADEGIPVLCSTNVGYAWTSDSPHLRRRAAEACAGCPVFDLCREVGQHEATGVWGGVDRTPTRGRSRTRVLSQG